MSDRDVGERVAYEWRDVRWLTYEIGVERDARWLGDWQHSVDVVARRLELEPMTDEWLHTVRTGRGVTPSWSVVCARCGRGHRGRSAQLRADLLAAVDGDRTVTLP